MGLDAGFPQNNPRSLSTSSFIKDHDMLVGFPSANLGYLHAPYVNGGDLENRGVELELNYRKTTGALTYEIGENLSTITNKVLSLEAEGPSLADSFWRQPTERGGQNVTITPRR